MIELIGRIFYIQKILWNNGIFSYIEEYIEGKMICGPGGGGFLQIILKKGVSPEAIKLKLKEIFDDSDIKVWECSFEI